MKAVKLPETILNADLITNYTLRGKTISVYYTNGSHSELVYANEDSARRTLDNIYEQLKEQEHGEM